MNTNVIKVANYMNAFEYVTKLHNKKKQSDITGLKYHPWQRQWRNVKPVHAWLWWMLTAMTVRPVHHVQPCIMWPGYFIECEPPSKPLVSAHLWYSLTTARTSSDSSLHSWGNLNNSFSWALSCSTLGSSAKSAFRTPCKADRENQSTLQDTCWSWALQNSFQTSITD